MPNFPFHELLGKENLRKLAGRTVETYPLEWRVVHEALQNAKDAVVRAGGHGNVDIALDLGLQSVTVEDDGTGFPYDPGLLGFGGTDKDEDPDGALGGRQGVGLKAVILGTKLFELQAIHAGKSWSLRIEDADTFLSGGDPEFEMSEFQPTTSASGTVVSYSFRDDAVSRMITDILNLQYHLIEDALADSRRARLALALETYFRTYSYAGDANALLGLRPPNGINVKLKIRANGEPVGHVPSDLLEELAESPLEVLFPCRYWDVEEAVSRTKGRRPRPTVLTQPLPPAGTFGRYNDSYMYVGKLTDRAGFESLLSNPNLRRPIDKSKYDRLFDQLRGLYIVIGSRSTIERYVVGPARQVIAADGTPSAHVIPGPQRGAEASYVANNIHFVADVAAKLNYGKQTIPNPRLVNQVATFFADAVRATLKNVAISIVGSQQLTSSADDLEDVSRFEQDVLARPELAENLLHFKREPRDENALIAIFFELIGRGALFGYHFYSMSQKAQYDGRAVIKLSNQDDFPIPHADVDLRTVEFKIDLNDLIDDFEREEKSPLDIQLIIVWRDSLKADIVDYQVVDIEYTGDADRAMAGVEKALDCKRHERRIQLFVMSDFVRRADVLGALRTADVSGAALADATEGDG
jgi:hypothetical protein